MAGSSSSERLHIISRPLWQVHPPLLLSGSRKRCNAPLSPPPNELGSVELHVLPLVFLLYVYFWLQSLRNKSVRRPCEQEGG